MKQFKGPKHQRGFFWVAAIAAAASAASGQKAANAQKKANNAQKAINQLRNKQAKRQFLQNFRAAQAASIVGAVGRGVAFESSLNQATLSSQQTQARLADAEFQTMSDLGAEITNQQNKASQWSANAQTFGAISSFAAGFMKT